MGVQADQHELEAILLQFSHGVRNELWARNMRMMIESYGWVSPSQYQQDLRRAKERVRNEQSDTG